MLKSRPLQARKECGRATTVSGLRDNLNYFSKPDSVLDTRFSTSVTHTHNHRNFRHGSGLGRDVWRTILFARADESSDNTNRPEGRPHRCKRRGKGAYQLAGGRQEGYERRLSLVWMTIAPGVLADDDHLVTTERLYEPLSFVSDTTDHRSLLRLIGSRERRLAGWLLFAEIRNRMSPA